MNKLIILFLTTFLWLPQAASARDAQWHFRKGHRLYLESQSAESELEFKRALQLDPGLSDAHYYLGSIYFKQERYLEAAAQCRQAALISPKDLKSLIILGLSLERLGRLEEAINTYLLAQDIQKDSAAVHSALGLAYCAKGELAKAKEQYKQLRQQDSRLAEDLLMRINEAE